MLKIGLVVLVLGVIGAFVFFNLKSDKTNLMDSIGRPSASLQNDKGGQDESEPPLKLKSIGVEFSDFKFTKQKLQFNRLFMGFGFVISASPDYPSKKNPQPTYILPLGTKVRSLVDGVVVGVPTVWSGDYSVMVGDGDDKSPWRYETEHVINVVVKVGDRVKAGQVVAEVSDYDTKNHPGFGIVEIGILHGGGEGPPEHVCPFAYLDDSIKAKTFKKMNDFFKSWEDYIDDQTLYDESLPIPGCLTQDPIEG